mgnify:CR=1 FL=1
MHCVERLNSGRFVYFFDKQQQLLFWVEWDSVERQCRMIGRGEFVTHNAKNLNEAYEQYLANK